MSREYIATIPVVIERSSSALSAESGQHVYADPRSKALFDYIQQIAPSEASILIKGETGTGKEMIARQIHQLSTRRHKPFIAVNCGAFSETLVESELFGHEKGAFTGALSANAGWFEAAHGGTIFLDEIGDLSKRIQVKLLRVLQEREVVRLGSRKQIPINVRVLAATNVNLEQAVAADQFREDLYYRLNVVNLEIAPLRERVGDILPLVQHFIDKYSTRLHYGQIKVTSAARQKMLAYSWPGNIRELENVVHHALLICRQQTIDADDIQVSQLQTVKSAQADAALSTAGRSSQELLHHVMEQLFQEQQGQVHRYLEDQLFRTAYKYAQYNQVHTAHLLGLSRNIVRARLIELGELVVSKRTLQDID